jgi:hypothetical protein
VSKATIARGHTTMLCVRNARYAMVVGWRGGGGVIQRDPVDDSCCGAKKRSARQRHTHRSKEQLTVNWIANADFPTLPLPNRQILNSR